MSFETKEEADRHAATHNRLDGSDAYYVELDPVEPEIIDEFEHEPDCDL